MKISIDDEPIGEVKRLSLGPDDVIVVDLNNQWIADREQAEMTKRLRSVFPGHRILIVPSGINLSVATGAKEQS